MVGVVEDRVADRRLGVFAPRDDFKVAKKAAADHNDAAVARASCSATIGSVKVALRETSVAWAADDAPLG